jgi:hypothetical protein
VSSAAIARTMNLMGIILSVVALLLMSSAAREQSQPGRDGTHTLFSPADQNFSRPLV